MVNADRLAMTDSRNSTLGVSLTDKAGYAGRSGAKLERLEELYYFTRINDFPLVEQQ